MHRIQPLIYSMKAAGPILSLCKHSGTNDKTIPNVHPTLNRKSVLLFIALLKVFY